MTQSLESVRGLPVVVAAGYSDSSCHKGTPAGLQTES